MKRIFMAVFAAILLGGTLLAQDTNPPASGSTPQEPQTPATAPSAQQAPEPSTSQPPSQPQQTPAQPAPEPSASQPQQPAAPQPMPGQAPPAGNAAQTSVTRKIAPGSIIPVQLTKTIDAKKVKTGDEVVAKVTQDMKTSSGEVLVPKDTKVVGHVTEAQPRTKEQKESQVGIAFDRAVMKNGGEMQLPMSIQAIIGPQNNNSNSGDNDQDTAPSASAGQTPSGNAGRTGGMSGSNPPPTASPSTGSSMPAEPQGGANAAGPITAQTQGVVGISNLKLETAGQNPAQGSVVSSDKNNVKLESGTMLLLRVNQ